MKRKRCGTGSLTGGKRWPRSHACRGGLTRAPPPTEENFDPKPLADCIPVGFTGWYSVACGTAWLRHGKWLLYNALICKSAPYGHPKKGPAHIREGDRGFVRLDGQGYLEVAPDPRLDMTRHCTVEAWVRNPSGMLVCKQVVWQWGFMFMVHPNGLATDALRVHGSMHLEGAYEFPKDTWTHVVAFGGSGAWKIYANGKLIGEREAMPAPVR